MSKYLLFCVFSLLHFTVAIAQWNANTTINTPVCTAPNKQVDTRMMDDGQGGAFIAWKDYRNGMPDIYIQHIDSLGNALWQVDGVALCTDPADQSTPAIVSDMRGGAIVAWSDWRSGVERDLYAQRVNANGQIMWQLDGAIVSNKPIREHNEKIISDGAGGAIVVWEQQQGDWDIATQRLDSNGVMMWANGGIVLFDTDNNRLNPKVQSDGKGGAFISCQDFRNGIDYDVYAQHIDANGILKWTSGGKVVCGAMGTQFNTKIDPDSSSGGVYIAWVDQRNGMDYDIYAQRIDSAGNDLWAHNGIIVCGETGNQSAVDILSNPKVGGCIFTWKDERNGNNDIYCQKLNSAGARQWYNNGVRISDAIDEQLNPNITGNGDGGAVICWQDFRNGNWDVYAQAVDKTGIVAWHNNGVAVSTALDEQSSAKNVSDKHGGSIFAWQDKRSGISDIYCHHLSAAEFGLSIKPSSPFISQLSIAPNPFENHFSLHYQLTQKGKISISVIDILGKAVMQIADNQLEFTELQHCTIDASCLSKGVYFLRLQGNDFVETLKIWKE